MSRFQETQNRLLTEYNVGDEPSKWTKFQWMLMAEKRILVERNVESKTKENTIGFHEECSLVHRHKDPEYRTSECF